MASLDELQPWLQPYAKYLLKVGNYYASDPTIHDWGGHFYVSSTYRSYRQQARLYERYMRGLSRIPAAPPGRSAHHLRLAFDMVRNSVDPYQDDLLHWLGHVWTTWGGQYGGATHDPVHFQAPLA